MKVFIAGGTGLIGNRLVRRLHERKNTTILVLSRRPAEARAQFGFAANVIEGDPLQPGPWMEAVEDCDVVINLVGESIFAKRWSEDFKKLLIDSRVKSTENLGLALARRTRRKDGTPKLHINASATGYYGPHGDEELDENSPPGDDFLANVCKEWEKAIQQVEFSGVRTAYVRIGVVLDKEGGALPKLVGPFRIYMGGPVGSGNQYISWIHHEDLVSMILFLLDQPTAKGAYNGTAPTPVTNKELAVALGKQLNRPSFLPTPGFALKWVLGEVADVVTQGQRVLPRRALSAGFTFKYPTIEGALADLLKEEPEPAVPAAAPSA
jgi:uncharacterized protein (TIGR01777 family)